MKLLGLFLLLAAACCTHVRAYGHQRVLLSQVQTITLTRGERTTGRRSAGVPQLTCVGGSAHCRVEPETVLCTNMGSNGVDATWKCEADLPVAYRLGKVTVTCEGYDYPDDPYILSGSCGLEYNLEVTEEGRHQQQSGGGWGGASSSNSYYNSHHSSGGSSGEYHSSRSSKGSFANFFWFIVFIVIAVMLIRSCSNRNRDRPEGMPEGRRDDYGGGGGGGPGGYPGGGGGGGYGSSSYGPAAGAGPGLGFGGMGAGGPGFWGGMMGGGLLGYMFGNRNRGYNQNYGYQPGGGMFGGYQQPGYARPAPSFGGGFGGFGGGGHSSGGGTSHSSSYGGTRRR